jgi:hypothetical protein
MGASPGVPFAVTTGADDHATRASQLCSATVTQPHAPAAASARAWAYAEGAASKQSRSGRLAGSAGAAGEHAVSASDMPTRTRRL